MSFAKELIDDLERDLSGEERGYGEDVYDLGPWPSPDEESEDAEHDE